MSGHTAEKWWIDDDGFIASGRGDDYKTLAQIIDTGSNGENNANAALIAAAPDLLAALERIANETCDHGAGFCPRDFARDTLKRLGITPK